MKATRLFFVALALVVLSSCFVPGADAGKKKLIKKLVKAGLVASFLKPKHSILPLPLPIPIPIGIDIPHIRIHKPIHHDPWHGGFGGFGGFDGFGHGGFGHGGFGGGFGHGGW